MKKIKKLLIITIFLSTMIINSFIIVEGQPRSLRDSQPNALEVLIYDAYYTDLDIDGYEDDIAIFVSFTINSGIKLRATFTLDIELPSSLKHTFFLEAWFSPSDTPIKAQISTFNTATESGWYTAFLRGIVRGIPLGSFITESSLIFDPPTGTGSGNPTASIRIL